MSVQNNNVPQSKTASETTTSRVVAAALTITLLQIYCPFCQWKKFKNCSIFDDESQGSDTRVRTQNNPVGFLGTPT